MSRQNKAFELFNQGKRPSDPELKALGLTDKTLYNYFQLWNKFVSSKQLARQEGKLCNEVSTQLSVDHNVNITQAANLQGTGVTCPVTPIVVAAIKAAVEQWEWPRNMLLENFLDTALYHLFNEKGVILEDYDYKIEK